MSKTAFATVGSTRFDGFVNRILSNDVIEALRREGYTKLVVQAGNSEIDQDKTPGIRSEDWVGRIHGLSVAIWKFKPSLEGEYRAADLVIGHAGSGTIIEALRLGCKMVAVPNPLLLHNHQVELAEELHSENYLVAATLDELPGAISEIAQKSLVTFPDYDGTKINTILDREMGFL